MWVDARCGMRGLDVFGAVTGWEAMKPGSGEDERHRLLRACVCVYVCACVCIVCVVCVCVA